MLKCRGCEGGNAATPAIRDAGWYRCGFCNTANAFEPGETSLCEGPASRVVVLQKLSRHHLIIPEGTLLTRGQLLLAGFASVSVLCLFGSILELYVSRSWRWVVALVVLYFLKLILQRLHRSHRTEQHIDVSPVRIRCLHTTKGESVEKFSEYIKDGELTIRVAEASHRGQRKRKLELVAPSGKSFKLFLAGEKEAVWTEKFLRQATDTEFQPGKFTCRGCGVQLSQELSDHGREFINCPYCSVGLLIGRSQIELAPAQLPHTGFPDGIGSPPLTVNESPDPTQLWIRVLAKRGLGLSLISVSSIGGFLMFGFMAMFTPIMAELTPPGTIILKIYVATVGLALGAMALMSAFLGIRGHFGQQRISLQDHHLHVRDLLVIGKAIYNAPLVFRSLSGAFDTSYETPMDLDDRGNAELVFDGTLSVYRQEYDLRLPVYLLSELRFQERASGATTMIVVAANRESRFTWYLPPTSSGWLKHRITSALEADLESLGRKVERVPAGLGSSVEQE